MTKKASTEFEVIELIKNRWSPRSFSEKGIEMDSIYALFEAAAWSASAFNEQPWRFIYGTKEKPETYNKIMSTLVEWNQSWAKNAPMLILCVAKLNFSHNNKLNRTALYDLGQAVSQLVIQATSMDLYVHQMSGFEHKKAEKEFNMPDDYTAISVLAVGYLGKPNELNEELRKLELTARSRNKLNSFVFDKEF